MEVKSPNTVAEQEQRSKTQFYYSEPKLIPIAQRAKEKPLEKFSNLMHHVSVDRIRNAIKGIKKDSASGPDGLSRDLTLEGLDWILPSLLDQIHKKSYEAPASKRVHIPKSNGKMRAIAIGNIVDRGIQGAVAEVLNHVYEQDFLKSSFGFRPKKNMHNALATIEHAVVNEGLYFLYEVDLQSFFDTLNHEWLTKFLSHRICDERILKLIDSWLKAGILEDGNVIKSEVGSAQGGSISPLLSNIYLHYVLDLWFEKKIRAKLKGRARLIRFADDFTVAFETAVDRDNFKHLLKARLDQFGLQISESKTHDTYLGPKSFKNVAAKNRRVASFLGFTIFTAKRAKGYGLKMVFKTDKSKLKKAARELRDSLKRVMHKSLKEQSILLNSILRGHFNYYGLAGNSDSLATFYRLARRAWRRSLARRSQKGHVSWETMVDIMDKYNIVTPRLSINYSTLKYYSIV